MPTRCTPGQAPTPACTISVAGDYRERLDVYLAALRDIDGLHAAGVVNFYGQLLQLLKNRLLLSRPAGRPSRDRRHRTAVAGGDRRTAPHRHHPPAQSAGRAAHLPHHAVLGKQRAVSIAVRSWHRAGSAADADGRRGRGDQHGDAAFRAHARDDHRSRPRRDPAAGQRLLDHAVRDAGRRARAGATITRPTTRPRTTNTSPRNSRRCSSCAAASAGCSSRPSISSRCRCWIGCSPDSIVVFTHRDPVPVALSMIAMITYSARMHRSPVPVEQIAGYWIDRLEQMLNALVRDRDTIGPERSVDIRFDDFMANESASPSRCTRWPANRSPKKPERRSPSTWPAIARPTGQRRNVLRDVRAGRGRPAPAASRRMSSGSWPNPRQAATFSMHDHHARTGRRRTQVCGSGKGVSRSTSPTPDRPTGRR